MPNLNIDIGELISGRGEAVLKRFNDAIMSVVEEAVNKIASEAYEDAQRIAVTSIKSPHDLKTYLSNLKHEKPDKHTHKITIKDAGFNLEVGEDSLEQTQDKHPSHTLKPQIGTDISRQEHKPQHESPLGDTARKVNYHGGAVSSKVRERVGIRKSRPTRIKKSDIEVPHEATEFLKAKPPAGVSTGGDPKKEGYKILDKVYDNTLNKVNSVVYKVL